jgi:nitrite reductase/ring-hydroxylating ferredoxin subunit
VPKLQINQDNTLGHDEENPVVRCPWHGWEFDLKTGAAVIPSRLKLVHFMVEVENNQIYILV